jgi:hypothetical protein
MLRGKSIVPNGAVVADEPAVSERPALPPRSPSHRLKLTPLGGCRTATEDGLIWPVATELQTYWRSNHFTPGQDSILLARSGATCFISWSRVVLLNPRPAKANQRK